MALFKRTYLVKQHDATDCAAACLAMVCLHYKKEISISKLRDILGTNMQGTTLAGLEAGGKELGFVVKALRVDKEGFRSRYTLPAIAHLITEEGLTHFVVVEKISRNTVKVLDPARRAETIDIDKFFQSFDGVLLLLAPSSDFDPSKQRGTGMFDRFMKLILSQKRLFIYAIIASAILTALGIISSLFNKFLMDEILPYGLKDELLVYVIAFMLVGLTQLGVSFIRQHTILYLSQKIDIRLVLDYFNHIFRLPMKFFATRKVGDVLTRFSDSFTIKNVLSSICLTVIMDVILAIVSGTILFFMSGALFTIIIFITLASAALVYAFKKPYKKINLERMEQAAKLNSGIIESLKGIETVKGNASEQRMMENIERDFIRSMRISFREGFLSNVQGSFSGIISQGGNLVLMYIGALQVIDNAMTLGTLLAFVTLSGFFMSPIGRLVGLQLQIQEANIAMKRMSEILDEEEEQEQEAGKKTLGRHASLESGIYGDICLEDVTFRYGYRPPVLQNLTLHVPGGYKVALVGESGCGKTTISKLLLNFFPAESGQVTINGSTIDTFDVSALRESIAYVPQNVELFSGSIVDNLRMAKPDATMQEIIEACELAGCEEFIARLPAKHHTFLEEAGGGLSGGERQRLAMARALVKKSRFLILDEATSNLDFISESKIYNTIFHKLKKTTMLIIAHRLSTIRGCDYIYVLDKGKVAEGGTHETLLHRQGLYYRMWISQVGEWGESEGERSRGPGRQYGWGFATKEQGGGGRSQGWQRLDLDRDDEFTY
ncbi:MAG: peptidase domain-containing ABC transporter [Peptococcaceae bacterium]|nr:peptidase domain-containing ABC transporter [Peptococcaceae bacterium]